MEIVAFNLGSNEQTISITTLDSQKCLSPVLTPVPKAGLTASSSEPEVPSADVCPNTHGTVGL